MTRTSTVRRRLAIALALIVGWAALLLFTWALRPIDDTVPIVVDPDGRYAELDAAALGSVVFDNPKNQLVECNTLFASSSRDPSEPLPELEPGFMYSRPPCDDERFGAQMAFALNTLVVLAMLAAWAFIALRTSRRPNEPSEPQEPNGGSTPPSPRARSSDAVSSVH